MADAPQFAARRLREQSLRVLAIDTDKGGVGQVFPEVGTPLNAGPVVVSGILRARKATVQVKIGYADDDARSYELQLRSGENAGHLAARGWATAKIDALSLDHAANQDDIRRTSREFGIVTAGTSLLVLETIEDYVRFDIPPPPELRAEWERRTRFADNNRTKERETHLDRVARAWAERERWWETKFPVRGGHYNDTRGGGVERGDALAAEEEPVMLSPFGVSGETAEGFVASSTIAGNRMTPELRDVGNAVTVVSEDQVRSAGDATNSEELLTYTTNTEVGSVRGDFAGTAESPVPAVGAVAGAVVGAVGEAQNPAEEKRLAQEARFRGAIDEELAVAEGHRRVTSEELAQSGARAASEESARLQAELAKLRGESSVMRARVAREDPSRRTRFNARMFEPWTGDTGCRDRFRRADRTAWYAIYLDEQADRARQPGFYLDVADFFLAHDERAFGLRVLSNLAELSLEDAPLLRVLAHRLAEAGRADLARPMFERVLAIRSEEPQSRRDLALVCAELGDTQRAIDLLWEVVSTPWHDRFPDIEMVALAELNAIAATHRDEVDLDAVDPRLRRNLACGLRVIVTWDADNADIDLWVDDPSGERCIYNHPRTRQGGRMSRDFTQGYGPEEFVLRDPDPGKYRIRLNYFGDRRQTALGPITAQVRVITGFGTREQKEERRTVRLASARDTIDLGAVVVR